MPYDLGHIEILRNNDAHFVATEFFAVYDAALAEGLPDVNFLDPMVEPFSNIPKKVEEGYKVPIESLSWSGEESGKLLDRTLIDIVVPNIRGEIWAVATYANGDTIEIWHIKDGIMECFDLFEALRSDVGVELMQRQMKLIGEMLSEKKS